MVRRRRKTRMMVPDCMIQNDEAVDHRRGRGEGHDWLGFGRLRRADQVREREVVVRVRQLAAASRQPK